MTSFGVQCVGTPMLTPYYSNEKGDIANRIQCAAEQTKNAAVTGIQAGAVIGATTALGYIAKKCPKVAEFLGKGIGKALEWLPVKNKIISAVKNASPKTKVAAAILAPAAALLSYVLGKGIYQTGQIDQKYTDAAKVESREKGYLL